jgi:hypothetical protein
LLVRNLAALLRAELGYQAAGVLTARIWLPETTGSEQDELVNELLRRLQTVPGVTSAALGLDAPLDSTDTQRSLMVTAPPHFVSAPARGALRLVTRGYFRTLGTRVVDGRGFLDDDLEARREVVLVNRAFAVQYCGGRAPGSFLEFSGGALAEIVGVVEDVRQRNIAEDPSPGVYRLYRQPPGGSRTLSTATVFVRWTRASSYLASRLQATIRELDTGVAVERVETLEDLRAGNLRQPRMYTVLLGIFALASLVIAVAGLFALVANSVTARWKEIGVRLALGASPAAIITLVLREAAAIALPGIIIGGLAAVGLAQTLANQLYGVDRYDPVSYLVAPSVVLAVAMLAALTPALRAVRMDAVDVLRCE